MGFSNHWFSEKLTIRNAIYLFISILWVLIISFDVNFVLWRGEVYALISTFFFSAASLIRKKISDHIWDEEISTLAILITSIYAFLYVLIFENDFTQLSINYSHLSLLYLIIWGFLFLAISFSWIYWFKRVSAIRASSLEYLEIFFAIALWWIFFSEFPSFKDMLGWFLIVFWAYCMFHTKYNLK